jgi:hypothetical protein
MWLLMIRRPGKVESSRWLEFVSVKFKMEKGKCERQQDWPNGAGWLDEFYCTVSHSNIKLIIMHYQQELPTEHSLAMALESSEKQFNSAMKRGERKTCVRVSAVMVNWPSSSLTKLTPNTWSLWKNWDSSCERSHRVRCHLHQKKRGEINRSCQIDDSLSIGYAWQNHSKDSPNSRPVKLGILFKNKGMVPFKPVDAKMGTQDEKSE